MFNSIRKNLLIRKDMIFYIKFFCLSVFLVNSFFLSSVIGRFYEISDGSYGVVGVIVFIVIWLLCFVSIIITSILPNIYLKFLLSLLISISSLADKIYYKISGHEIDYDVLQLLWESRNFTGDAFHFYSGEILSSFFIVIVGMVGLLLPVKWFLLKKKFKKVMYIYSLLPYFVMCFLVVVQGGFSTGGLPVQYKSTSLFAVMLINDVVVTHRRINAEISIPLEISRFDPKPDIVLIIDESVRGDFLDINRNIGVTPFLYSHKNRLANFGYVSSGANCSQTSNQIIRIGANPHNFNDSIKNNPYIWQYAKHAGYKTIMIDSQVSKGKKNNRLSKTEISLLDKFYYVAGVDSREKDIKAGRLIKKILSRKREQPYFIFFVKSGVHFPYEERYPADAIKFTPDRKLGEPLDNVEKLVNSYKNVLSWVTDGAFADFLNMKFMNSVIIYTSDHGQSLLDQGNKLSHCSVKNISMYEALVPLFILTDNPVWKEIFYAAAIKNKDKGSHFNIVPTILDIFGYSIQKRLEIHGKSLLDVLDDDEQRRFTYSFLALERLNPISARVKWHNFSLNHVSSN